MRVYVETNFVLEMALLRSDSNSCGGLVRLAESRRIALVFPAFSIGESYEALSRRTGQRRQLGRMLRSEVLELSRSQPYSSAPQEFAAPLAWLHRCGNEERVRLEDTLASFLEVVQVIPIGPHTVRAAAMFQMSRKLSSQDSMVYASVLDHLANSPEEEGHCFVTQDSKGFFNPMVQSDLASLGCRLFTRFRDTLGYAHSRL